MIVRIILFAASLLLYYNSDNTVNYKIIYCASLLFLYNCVLLLKDNYKNDNYIAFNVFFSVSFFLCTYAFSLFVLNTPFWDLGNWIASLVDFSYITRGVTLSTIAFSVYCIGYERGKQKKYKFDVGNKRNYSLNFRPLFFSSSVLMILNIIYVIRTSNTINVTISPFLGVLYNISLCLSFITRSKHVTTRNFYGFINAFKYEIIISIVLCLLYLYIGDRGLPIFVGLVFMYVYSNYFKKFRHSFLLAILLIGASFMYLIRVTRTGENSIRNSSFSVAINSTQSSLESAPPILIFADLLGANYEMCTALEYVDRFGYNHPDQIVLVPLTPFPILPSLAAYALYGTRDYNSLLASTVLNNFTIDNFGAVAHWGNHVVTDIYYRWGIIGVIIVFFIFGSFVKMVEMKKESNLFYSSVLLLMFGLSVYLARDSIISLIRPITWIYVAIVLYRKFYKKKI